MSRTLEARWQSAPDDAGKAKSGTNTGTGNDNGADFVTLIVNGQSVSADPSDTVATALLRAGYVSFGLHPKTGHPLAPSCMMGVCFGCLCTIDGRPGSQACLEPVQHGLTVQIDSVAGTTAHDPAP